MKSFFTAAKIIRLQLGGLVMLLLFMMGHKFGVLEFKLAFLAFVGLVLLVAVLGGIALIVGLFGKSPKRAGLGGLVLGLLPIIAVFTVVGKGIEVPPIHNISTDLNNPPVFTAAHRLRSPAENSLAPASAEIRALQASYYKSIGPLVMKKTPEHAYAKAVSAAETLGWQIHHKNPEAMTFEAVDETLFFGFKDDVVVRVVSRGQGSQVDVRSVSRVGQSDLGANAKRIERFMALMIQP